MLLLACLLPSLAQITYAGAPRPAGDLYLSESSSNNVVVQFDGDMDLDDVAAFAARLGGES